MKGNLIPLKPCQIFFFNFTNGLCSQWRADRWKKCAPSAPWRGAADSSSAHQKTEKKTRLSASDSKLNPSLQTEHCGLPTRGSRGHGEMFRRGEVTKGGRRVFEAMSGSLIPPVHPDFPLAICGRGSHLPVSGRGASSRSIAIASSPQQ